MRRPDDATVCLVHASFSSYSETFVRRHLAELNGGRTVAVQFRDPEQDPGRPVLVLDLPPPVLKQPLWSPPLPPPVIDPEVLQRFSRFAETHRVSEVLCEFGPIGLRFYRYAKALGLPVFCYFRGYDASKLLRQRTYRRQVAEMLDSIDGIVAVSQNLLDRLGARRLMHANSIVVPSGVDPARFDPMEKDPDLIVAVGRLVEKKAPLTTIRAFARVAQTNPKLRLEMIGDGWLHKRARQLVERLGLADRIILHGARDSAFTTERLGRAAIFMQHSVVSLGGDVEGAPTSIQEAMVAGCAVVTTRHAGIPELIRHGETGLMVRERDLRGYAAALRAVSQDADLRSALGTAARSHALGHFDYRQLYARLEVWMRAAPVQEVVHNRSL